MDLGATIADVAVQEDVSIDDALEDDVIDAWGSGAAWGGAPGSSQKTSPKSSQMGCHGAPGGAAHRRLACRKPLTAWQRAPVTLGGAPPAILAGGKGGDSHALPGGGAGGGKRPVAAVVDGGGGREEEGGEGGRSVEHPFQVLLALLERASIRCDGDGEGECAGPGDAGLWGQQPLQQGKDAGGVDEAVHEGGGGKVEGASNASALLFDESAAYVR